MMDFQIALLKLVAKGNGQWSWYEIGNRLPGPYLDKSAEMFDSLKHLVDEGYLVHHTEEGQAGDRWELSAKGKDILDKRLDLL
jgi:PadR family transcriptional regulator PadR